MPSYRYVEIGNGVKMRTDHKDMKSEAFVFPWRKYFAWYPVKVYNKWMWLKHIYRRRVFYTIKGDTNYEYGTVFDVLID